MDNFIIKVTTMKHHGCDDTDPHLLGKPGILQLYYICVSLSQSVTP